MVHQARRLLAARHIPEPYRAIKRPRGEARPVRAERHRSDRNAITFQTRCLLPARRSQSRTVVARGEARPVRAERHRQDPTAMTLQACRLLAACHVPQPHRGFIRARGEARPVRAERHRQDPAPWPSRRAVSFPLATSHRRTVLSWAPEARRIPSGLNATEVTGASWPERISSANRCCRVARMKARPASGVSGQFATSARVFGSPRSAKLSASAVSPRAVAASAKAANILELEISCSRRASLASWAA